MTKELEFFQFMQERHNIYINSKVKKLPKPWTKDKILQRYKFCNVFRELDTVTLWIKENIRDRWNNHILLWFALCVARRINWPPTLQKLDDLLVNWEPYDAVDLLDHLKYSKEKIYSSAYMLTTHGSTTPKNDYTVFNVLQPLWNNRFEITSALMEAKTLQEAHLIISQFWGFSGFLAYEVITDLRHTRWLNQANDIYTWAYAGPGASRGLNRIFDRKVSSSLCPIKAVKEMQMLLYMSQQRDGHYLPKDFPELEMRDIEHTLCEFDKYLRAKEDLENLRNKYNGLS